MAELIYINGSLLPRPRARVSALDHGFLYGHGAFETLRSYRGRFFRLESHLDRLFYSLERVGIALALSREDLAAALYRTLEANGLKEARVRLTVSAGQGEATPEPLPSSTPVVITAQPFTPPPPQAYQRGYSAVFFPFPVLSRSALSGVKSTNYISLLLARRWAQQAGAQEALLLNERGFLVEASNANLFLVVGEGLVTPEEGSGPLLGITRGVALELARGWGIPCRERAVRPGELAEASEAFLTSSLLEVMPLTRVEGRPVGSGEAGELSLRLLASYRERVEAETSP